MKNSVDYRALTMDPHTGEYYYRGKWYDSYPEDEIEKSKYEEDMANDQIERNRD